VSVPAYPAYNDSGVDWLGEVPAHWGVGALKRSFAIIGGTTPKADNPEFWDGGIPWATPTDLGSSGSFTISETGRTISEAGLASCGTTMVPAGSVILSTRAPIGSLGIAGVPLCTNQGCKSLMPLGDACPAFFAHLLSVSTAELNIRGSGSTFLELSGDKLGAFQVPVPPPAEQAAIAAFLDRETVKIDALVEEQRRLIALLKEKRQAVISHAVTKGLNPQAPLKPSGIEWLGDIPAHWEVVPLKRIWTVTDCKHLTAEFVPDGVPLASIKEVQSWFVDLSDAKRTTDDFYAQLIDGGRLPVPGDLIFSRNATVGEVAQIADWHPPFAMGQDVCLLHKHDAEASTDFFQAVLKSRVVVEQLQQVMIGATFKRVNVEEIRNLIVPVPPPAEQAMIARLVIDSSESLDALIGQAEAAATLLQERRAALISAAVTGKIDVHGLVDLPQAVEAA
jgi:type I restriction enzyme S subunit